MNETQKEQQFDLDFDAFVEPGFFFEAKNAAGKWTLPRLSTDFGISPGHIARNIRETGLHSRRFKSFETRCWPPMTFI
jgi:AraC-like DNA-binding protein